MNHEEFRARPFASPRGVSAAAFLLIVNMFTTSSASGLLAFGSSNQNTQSSAGITGFTVANPGSKDAIAANFLSGFSSDSSTTLF